MAPATVAELIDTITASRNRLEASLRTLSDEQLIAPMLENGWSVKDTLAHLAFWEQRMRYGISHPATDANPALPPEIADIAQDDTWVEAVNTRFYQQSRDRSLEDVRRDAAASYADTLAAIAALTDDDLFKPNGLSQRIKRNALALIADNTYEHYDEHSAVIERAFPTSA